MIVIRDRHLCHTRRGRRRESVAGVRRLVAARERRAHHGGDEHANRCNIRKGMGLVERPRGKRTSRNAQRYRCAEQRERQVRLRAVR